MKLKKNNRFFHKNTDENVLFQFLFHIFEPHFVLKTLKQLWKAETICFRVLFQTVFEQTHNLKHITFVENVWNVLDDAAKL